MRPSGLWAGVEAAGFCTHELPRAAEEKACGENTVSFHRASWSRSNKLTAALHCKEGQVSTELADGFLPFPTLTEPRR